MGGQEGTSCGRPGEAGRWGSSQPAAGSKAAAPQWQCRDLFCAAVSATPAQGVHRHPILALPVCAAPLLPSRSCPCRPSKFYCVTAGDALPLGLPLRRHCHHGDDEQPEKLLPPALETGHDCRRCRPRRWRRRPGPSASVVVLVLRLRPRSPAAR